MNHGYRLCTFQRKRSRLWQRMALHWHLCRKNGAMVGPRTHATALLGKGAGALCPPFPVYLLRCEPEGEGEGYLDVHIDGQLGDVAHKPVQLLPGHAEVLLEPVAVSPDQAVHDAAEANTGLAHARDIHEHGPCCKEPVQQHPAIRQAPRGCPELSACSELPRSQVLTHDCWPQGGMLHLGMQESGVQH